MIVFFLKKYGLEDARVNKKFKIIVVNLHDSTPLQIFLDVTKLGNWYATCFQSMEEIVRCGLISPVDTDINPKYIYRVSQKFCTSRFYQ